VLGVDVSEHVVEAIESGTAAIDEPGVAVLAEDRHIRERFRGSTTPDKGDIFVIAVPTPLDQSGRAADLSMVESATRSIVPYLRPGNLVIVESTVPPRTCQNLIAPIIGESGVIPVHLAHCPERVLPGTALYEMVQNDRIIGGIDEASMEAARTFYASFVRGDLIPTDDVTAEFCKLVENTHRDVSIALANQVATVAESFGVDPHKAIALANRHPRVDLLRPGIGVGGHCIPLDPWFLMSGETDETVLIEIAREINDEQPIRVAARIQVEVLDQPRPRVLLIGAAYKPNVADTRESPALRIRQILMGEGIDVEIYDPHIESYSSDLVNLADGTDLVAILVPHDAALTELRNRNRAVLAAMRTPQIVDFSSGRARSLTI
jgi:UDP-N-acetyl-D-mannosaminuronic acid dehydrogenase